MKPKTHPTVDNKGVKKQFELLKLTTKQEKELTEFLIGRATAWEEKIEKAKGDVVTQIIDWLEGDNSPGYYMVDVDFDEDSFEAILVDILYRKLYQMRDLYMKQSSTKEASK